MGERIANARNKKGFSQRELAELLFEPQQRVSDWETGERIPTTKQLALLSQVLECTTDYLLLGKVS